MQVNNILMARGDVYMFIASVNDCSVSQIVTSKETN